MRCFGTVLLASLLFYGNYACQKKDENPETSSGNYRYESIPSSTFQAYANNQGYELKGFSLASPEGQAIKDKPWFENIASILEISENDMQERHT